MKVTDVPNVTDIKMTPTGRVSKAKCQGDYNQQKRERYAANEDVRDASRKRCIERYHRTKILKKPARETTTEVFDENKITG